MSEHISFDFEVVLGIQPLLDAGMQDRVCVTTRFWNLHVFFIHLMNTNR